MRNNISIIKKNFFKNGFVVVKNVISLKKIGKIKREIKKVKQLSEKIKNPNLHYTKDKKINTVHNLHKYLKRGEIISISKDKNVLNIVSNILENKPIVRNIEFFSKPKKTGMMAPFHQDNFYWKFDDKKALNIWIACNKSNKNNGGLNYFIKSHKHGLKKHITSFAPGSSYKIEDKIINKMKLKKVYPNLNKGDMLIHHCEVIHGSNRNNSNYDREGLVISYRSKDSKPNKRKLRLYKLNVKKNLKFLSN